MRFVSLVRREFLDQVSSLRFLALTGTVAILTFLAIHAGSIDLVLRQEIATEFIRQRAADQSRNGGRLSAFAVEPGLRVVRSPSEWSLFVRGIDPILPAYWDFSPSRVQAGPSALAPQPTARSEPALDIEFLIRVVLGLLALLMGRDSIVRARETGSLRALLSQPIPSWLVLASKMTAGAIALLIALALLIGGAVAGARFWMPAIMTSAMIEFFLGIFLTGFLYLLLLLFTGFALAATLRSGTLAISLSIVLWLYVALVAPLLMPVIGTVLGNPQPAVEVQLQAAYDREFRTTREELGRQLAAWQPVGSDIRSFTNIDPPTAAKLEGLWHFRAEVQRGVLEAHEIEARAEIAKQRRVIRILTWMSPASSLTEGLSSMAGTSSLLQERWDTAIRARQQTLNGLVFDDPPRVGLMLPQDQGSMVIGFDRHAPRVVSDLPQFESPNGSAKSRFADAMPNITILGAYSLAALAWTFVAFMRRDI